MKILCCIPARFQSTRLEGKPLYKINNKTIINLVYENASKTNVCDVVILTDDKRIYDEVIGFGGKCEIITDYCLNGTDRIVRYLNLIDHSSYDAILNLQGDEPFINPDHVNMIIDNFIKKQNEIACSTLCYKTDDETEIILKSRGKTVVDKNNNVMYCSRNVIPTNKQFNIIPNYKYNIHVGIFLFDKNYLLNEYMKENTNLQLAEDIEWMKIIEQGYKINVVFVENCERGVDTIEDYNYLVNKYRD